MSGRFEELLQAHLDGTLGPEERRELGELLKGNPEWARRLAFASKLDVLIQHLSKAPADLLPASARSTPALTRRRSIHNRTSVGSVAWAAAIIIGVVSVLSLAATRLRRESTPPLVKEASERRPLSPSAEEAPAPDPAPDALPPPAASKKPAPMPIKPPEASPDAPRQEEPSPPPAPAPPPAVAPPADPIVPSPSPRPRPTEAAAATVESVRGEAAVRHDGRRRALAAGMVLHRTDILETVGSTSGTVVRLPDQTRVEVWGNSVLAGIDPPDVPERRIALEKGSIWVEAAPRAPARALVFDTPEAEVRIVGTAFQLATGVEASVTRLDVDEGRAKVTRRADNRSVEVVGGQFAVAAPGVELRAQRQADQRRVKNAAYPGVDVKKVDLAIERGLRFLKTAPSLGYEQKRIADCDELLLLTFAHAGVSPSDGRYQELLGKMLTAPLERTYKVVLQAMVLEEIDRVKHQRRIAQCGQFLVDSQCGSGQWSYGQPSAFLDDIPEPTPGNGAVATAGSKTARNPAGKAMDRAKPEVLGRIVLRKKADGPGTGDNSNSQYAALGLRACAEAGVVVPRETLERARKWWIGSQQARDAKGERKAVPSGPRGGAAGGWCYGGADHGHAPYGSMTAGAVGAMVIYDHMLKLPWKKDETVLRGLAWMSLHYSVTSNPGPAEWDAESPGYMLYYYLYAVERAGVLTGLEKLGEHPWYATGVRSILAAQAGDGSWKAQALEANSTWDTCFAILFLTRATSPLDDVPSVDRFGEK